MAPVLPRGLAPLLAGGLALALGACGSADAGRDLSASPDLAARPDLSSGAGDLPLADLGTGDAAEPVDAAGRVIDPTTASHKLLMGYQGWFFCPGDGSPIDGWVHWFRGDLTPTVDLWPDVSELAASELCATGLTTPLGGPAPVYSANNPATVARHFQWMKDQDLDGVLVQRFTTTLGDPRFFAAFNQVLLNARAAAEASGRVFAVQYDISGQDPAAVVATLESDWSYLVDTLKITESPRYLRHKGRPLLSIWGFGVPDRPSPPADAQTVIDYFKSNAATKYQVTLMGGVAGTWRDDAAWNATIRHFDIISPWTVGGFVDDAGADAFKARVAADLADATAHGVEYMPVVFPGFTWHNLTGGPSNQIPRRGGRFYWRQVYNTVSVGATMLYGAMFDEVDEGTAMFKMAPTHATMPTQFPFVALDVDGEALPSDWYLRLANQAGKALRGELALSPQLPITP